MYETLGLAREFWKDADDRWLVHFSEETPELLEGAAETLAALQRRGMALGIVSSGTKSRIEQELVRMGLADAFGALVCNEGRAPSEAAPGRSGAGDGDARTAGCGVLLRRRYAGRCAHGQVGGGC